MTHDMEFQLPHLFFGGGSVKIEPKSFLADEEEDGGEEGEGTVVKIVFKPPPSPDSKGRLFFSHLSKFSLFFVFIFTTTSTAIGSHC